MREQWSRPRGQGGEKGKEIRKKERNKVCEREKKKKERGWSEKEKRRKQRRE